MPENIIKSYEYNDLISFKVECDCCEHDMVVVLYKDENKDVSLTIEDHANITTINDGKSFLEKIWYRTCIAWKILTIGRFTMSYTFVFKGKEQIEDFVGYLAEKSKRIIEENEKSKH